MKSYCRWLLTAMAIILSVGPVLADSVEEQEQENKIMLEQLSSFHQAVPCKYKVRKTFSGSKHEYVNASKMLSNGVSAQLKGHDSKDLSKMWSELVNNDGYYYIVGDTAFYAPPAMPVFSTYTQLDVGNENKWKKYEQYNNPDVFIVNETLELTKSSDPAAFGALQKLAEIDIMERKRKENALAIAVKNNHRPDIPAYGYGVSYAKLKSGQLNKIPCYIVTYTYGTASNNTNQFQPAQIRYYYQKSNFLPLRREELSQNGVIMGVEEYYDYEFDFTDEIFELPKGLTIVTCDSPNAAFEAAREYFPDWKRKVKSPNTTRGKKVLGKTAYTVVPWLGGIIGVIALGGVALLKWKGRA